MKTKLNALILALLILAACSPVSRQALKQVNTTAPFQEIRKEPDRFLNKTVLWGGIIIDTTVRNDGTYIKVLETSLDSEKRPTETEKSGGRFIIYDRGFLDPAIYKNGREITVVGTLTGKQNQSLGEITYTYPVINAKNIYLWKPLPEYRYPYYYPPYPYGPYPYDGWW